METDYKKLYECALEKIKDLYDNYDEISCLIDMKQEFEKAFPQLKESDDERIRKVLIDLIQGINSWNYFLGVSKEQMLSWLEKQGEQKTFNEDEFLRELVTEDSISDTLYNRLKTCGWYVAGLREWCNSNDKKNISLESLIDSIDEALATGGEYMGADAYNTLEEGMAWLKTFKPAPQPKQEWSEDIKTNLDRAIQIIKMAKGNLNGYQTDDGIYECDKAIECIEHLKPNKWSEDDEKHFDRICGIINKTDMKEVAKMGCIEWLKSLKPQPHWKPTDEQMIDFEIAIDFLKNYGYATCKLISLYNDLKKL